MNDATVPEYAERTSLEVERGGVRIRIDGIPSRTNRVGGEAMIPGPLAEEIGDAIDAILTAVERHNAVPAVT